MLLLANESVISQTYMQFSAYFSSFDCLHMTCLLSSTLKINGTLFFTYIFFHPDLTVFGLIVIFLLVFVSQSFVTEADCDSAGALQG